MSYRFRLAENADLSACAALLRSEGCFVADDRLWSRIPELWRALIDSPAAHFVVWEDLAAPTHERLQSFAISVIVGDDFAQEVRARGRAWSGALLYQRMGSRASPLLGEREIGRANAGDGVNIVVLHNPLRYRAVADPRLQAVMPLGMAAFHFCHGGYYARCVLWEVYGPDHTQLLADGGYRLLDNFESDPAVRRIPEDQRPFLMGLLRDDAELGAYHPNALWLFQPAKPLMRFTSAQRRLLRHALLGASDRDLASVLGVSEHSVRQSWRAIHERALAALPGLFPQDAREGLARSERGPSMRRVLQDYLRQHLHELRPYGDASQRP